MKTIIKQMMFAATAWFTMVAGAFGATFTDLHIFSGNDGACPSAGLVLSGNILYGTTLSGGSNEAGTVFAINVNGAGFTNLYNFQSPTWSPSAPQGYAGLILSGNTLYGTMLFGTNGYGAVFSLNTDGTGFTDLHDFTGNDGENVCATLVVCSNILFGTTCLDGSVNSPGIGFGTIYSLKTDGKEFVDLYDFNGDTIDSIGQPGLAVSDQTLYGARPYGGSNDDGCIFAVNTNGADFTNLYSFSASTAGSPAPNGNYTNNDGAIPRSVLILSGNTLYGTAMGGGTGGQGTVFAINTDGTGFTNLYNFTAVSNGPVVEGAGPPIFTNSDGAEPVAGLILSGNTLYGTTEIGGSGGSGTIFAINTDGTGFTNLYNFSLASSDFYNTKILYFDNAINSEGALPYASLVLVNNTLYGTTFSGGPNGDGTVFALNLGPIPLHIQMNGDNVILTWPTNVTDFTLQSTTHLSFPAIWAPVSAIPSIVNGQNTVTNPITNTQQFYSLIKNTSP